MRTCVEGPGALHGHHFLPVTLSGCLAKHQRRDQVAKHTRRLVYEEEDAKILADHVSANLSSLLCVRVSHDGEVGALRGPQRGRSKSQQDGSGDQCVPEK